MKTIRTDEEKEARNEDPLSGAPGAHPAGSGVGALLGGLAGAAIGTAIAGPVGGAAGAGLVTGALAGGLAGKAVGEGIDPTVEDDFWRDRHPLEAYGAGEPYDTYEPAYRAGYEGFERHGGQNFADVESDIRADYESNAAGLPWDKARPASEAAWNRVSTRQANTKHPGMAGDL